MFIIDKIFNLKIDTKNKNITTVAGLKQFDNNSVLNITLLQNSLALDLSNCTVRINFLREDERVLLYMANIDNAREGKVSIKLSPEVLEKNGLVKADISVFDSNLLKITSATFNLRVEKSIYNDTYFTEKDLDLMQQEYVREKERQNNENTRKSNETARIQAETKRNSNENTRNSNEEARKKAESTRVSEWNNVKKDANNIKNTLDTTIDTANKSNSNLQNTINNADKLKQELNVNNYVTNAKYSEFEKKTNSQYEDLTKQLKENSTKTITKNSNIIDLENNVEGIANIQIGGNTLYKRKNNTYTDKWEEGCTLQSVGEKEKQIEVKSVGKNLFNNAKATSYEPYKEDKVNIQLKEPLRGLPNGVRDTVNSDGTITRRVGKIVLDGTEINWRNGFNSNDGNYFITYLDLPLCKPRENKILCDKFKVRKDILDDSIIVGYNDEFAGIHSLYASNTFALFYISIQKSKLSTADLDGFKKYLKENPTTVYYELAEPTTENIGQPLNLQTFEGGHIVVDTKITPFITIDYPTNLSSRISSIESTEVSLKDSLGGAWKSLLILADKELKMKSIKTLETETNKDIKNKINEILEVW